MPKFIQLHKMCRIFNHNIAGSLFNNRRYKYTVHRRCLHHPHLLQDHLVNHGYRTYSWLNLYPYFAQHYPRRVLPYQF